MLGAVVEDLAVDLVAHHRDLGVVFEPGDETVEFDPRHDAAGRVGRAVDDDQPGARRYLVQDLGGAEREAGAFVERDRYRRRAGKTDHALVDREAGVRIKDFGPGLAEHQDREKHRDLAAGDDKHPVGRDFDPVAAVEIGGDRLAQLRDTVGRRVAVMAVGQRLAAGLDDVLGGREIGLADAEIDDRAALRGQRVGARQDLESSLGAEDAHAPGHLQHSRFLLTSPSP